MKWISSKIDSKNDSLEIIAFLSREKRMDSVVYSTIYQTAGHIPWNASQPQIFDDLFAITFFIFCLFIN